MREIKFRAWHQGQMLTQPVNTPYGASRLFGFLDTVGLHAFDDVMQFTGLHDKKGREIYEGDILRVEEFHFESSGPLPDNLTVVYYEDAFELWRGSQPLMGLRVSSAKVCEIIGNIYQNPDLLK